MPFVKGDPNINRKGRPKGTGHKQFLEVLKDVEAKKNKSLVVHAIERAYKDDKVLIAVLKKYLPDLSAQQLDAIITESKTLDDVLDVKRRGTTDSESPADSE